MAIVLDKPIVSSEWLVEQIGGVGVNGKNKKENNNNNKSSKISGNNNNNFKKHHQNMNT